MKSYPKTVEEILTAADAENRSIIEKLRGLIKETIPDIEETVKRGSITYVLLGKNLFRIRAYSGHIDLGFFNGDKLASMLLKTRGRGKTWRHVEIRMPVDAVNQEIERLLKKSARLLYRQA